MCRCDHRGSSRHGSPVFREASLSILVKWNKEILGGTSLEELNPSKIRLNSTAIHISQEN